HEGFTRPAAACGRGITTPADVPAEADHCSLDMLDGGTPLLVGFNQRRSVQLERRLHQGDQVGVRFEIKARELWQGIADREVAEVHRGQADDVWNQRSV